jgi:hypothetical protein
MAPFRYDTPTPAPFAGTIADLITRGGDLRAQSALQIANLQAQQQAARGALWGNTVANLSQLPLQIDAQRRADAAAQSQDQLRRLDLLVKTQQAGIQGAEFQQKQEDRQAQQTGDTAVRELFPQFQKPDATTGATSLDVPGFAAALRDRKVPEKYVSDWLTKYDTATTAQQGLVSRQQAQRQQVLDAGAGLAHEATDADTFRSSLGSAVAAGTVPPLYAKRVTDQLGQYGDDNFGQFQKDQLALSQGMQKFYDTQEEARAKAAKDRADALAAGNKQPPRVPVDQEKLDAYAVSLGHTNASQLTDAEQQAYTNRTRAQANADALAQWQQQQAYTAAHKPTADPVGIDSDTKYTTTGVPYVDMSKYKGKDYAAAIREAHDKGVYAANATEATALANIQTARDNMGEVAKVIPRLSTVRVPGLTGLIPRVEAAFSDPELKTLGTNTDAAVQAMKAVAGSSGLRVSKDLINQSLQNNTPAISDTQDVATEKLRKFNLFLDDTERRILGSAAPAPSAAAPASTGPFTVQAPDGQTYPFPTQAAADAFRKRIGG